MSQQLFRAGKIGCFIDLYTPGVEKRRGEVVSVISIKFRVQPFDAKLATALDDGVGDDSNIRATVFSLNTGDPKPNFTRHDFKLALARQNLELFASPDTQDARVVLLQAKISGTYVRTQKDMNALALVFKATFGPVGRDELELVHSLHRLQTFISFAEAEPLLEFEVVDEDEGTDADQKSREVVNGRPAPMWDDPPADERVTMTGPDGEVLFEGTDGEFTAAVAQVVDKPERAHRPLHTISGGKKRSKAHVKDRR